ncbi:tail fiber domain-containing protein [Thiohalocapsa marina]|uniref:Tail fiber domain-containing protein n=1 Tax=Thiohalocapsa marina TaxID=424902 RepID=A0A5M8FVL4_9GAMM|nr:tail fiber domain-containing protein [Thiohalocapsa marina]KAA6187864.1 tail fiber domain-containing protein [Thiohalocapsa marina]
MLSLEKKSVVMVSCAFTLSASMSVSVCAQDALYINEQGSVGIGTDAPIEQLHIVGGADGVLKMRLEQSDTNAWAYSLVATNGPGTKFNLFRVSKQGSGGPEIEVSERYDAGGVPTLEVFGSVRATNIMFSSSRELKTDFQPLDTHEILQKVAALPIMQWRFKSAPPDQVHMGPMAEDFADTFQLDGPNHSISVADSTGITLAAIQGLVQELAKRDQRIEHLQQQIDALTTRLDEVHH